MENIIFTVNKVDDVYRSRLTVSWISLGIATTLYSFYWDVVMDWYDFNFLSFNLSLFLLLFPLSLSSSSSSCVTLYYLLLTSPLFLIYFLFTVNFTPILPSIHFLLLPSPLFLHLFLLVFLLVLIIITL